MALGQHEQGPRPWRARSVAPWAGHFTILPQASSLSLGRLLSGARQEPAGRVSPLATAGSISTSVIVATRMASAFHRWDSLGSASSMSRSVPIRRRPRMTTGLPTSIAKHFGRSGRAPVVPSAFFSRSSGICVQVSKSRTTSTSIATRTPLRCCARCSGLRHCFLFRSAQSGLWPSSASSPAGGRAGVGIFISTSFFSLYPWASGCSSSVPDIV